MDGLNGDFLGFTFITNGKAHTSQKLGITRVSDGDRYNEPLIPEIEDKTIEIPGLDGTYFYGSDFKTRNFSIKIAFDGMTEENFREMRQVFGYKHMGLLIFDEAPYKQYKVKVASPPELEYVCFNERKKVASTTPQDGVRVATREEVPYDIVEDPDNLYTNVGIDAVVGESVVSPIPQSTTIKVTREQIYPWEYVQDGQGNDVYERIYKGEGTIEFIAYYPFATQTHKFLDDFDQVNVNEWVDASRLLTEERAENIDKVVTDIGNKKIINVYNAGDVPTGFMLWVPFKKTTTSEETTSYTIQESQEPYVFEIEGDRIVSVMLDEQPISTYTYDGSHLSVTIDSEIDWSESHEITVTYATSTTTDIEWTNDLKLQYGEDMLILSKDAKPESTNEMGILINTVNGLAEGVINVPAYVDGNVGYVTSGTVYNRYITGRFFKIDLGESIINVLSIPMEDASDIHIFYNYLYF